MAALNLTEANFNKKLASWVRGAKSKRDELQEFIVFGVLHAQEHDNDFTKLTDVMKAAEGVRAFPNQDICDYIKKVITGITWKVKDKVFKRASKKTVVEYNIGFLESETWYEFSKSTNEVQEVDFNKQLATFMKRMRKAIDEGTIKDGQEDMAAEFMQAATDFLK
jgi:hypothetical protein